MKRHIVLYSIVLCISGTIWAEISVRDVGSVAEKNAIPQSSDRETQGKQPMIRFVFKDKELVDIIYIMAEYKEVNVLLPLGNDAIKTKVSIVHPDDLSVAQSWELLQTILRLAGYAMVQEAADLYHVIKINNLVTREPFQLYIGVPAQELPDSDQYIRYLYYVSNIRLLADDPNNEIMTVLTKLLPQDSLVKMDASSNAIIIVAPANAIKSALEITAQLDKSGFQEQLEVLKLTYAAAVDVANLINEKMLGAKNDVNRLRADVRKTTDAAFFSSQVKIVADPRTNRLIMRGRPQAIERLRDFINAYIDVELETGKSVLHVYQLRYLDAEEVARVIRNVVTANKEEGGKQSTTDLEGSGTERYFDEVIVATDRGTPSNNAPQQGAAPEYAGGNKLIIAARNDDWKRIKKLLDDLDQPQRQVLLEVLIADLSIDDTRAIRSMVRNPARISMPANMAIQSSQGIGPGILPNSCSNPTTIGLIENPEFASSDLLRQAFSVSNGTVVCDDAGTLSPADFLEAGSTVISISDSDGSTWGIGQVLKQFTNLKVISHPHVVATHNQKAVITGGQQLIIPDQAATDATTAEIKYVPVDANLSVSLTPRMSGTDIINLQIDVSINDFISTTFATRATRTVSTNTNLRSTDILAMGGLIRVDASQTLSETPILGKIPILGYFFKGRTGEVIRTNLTIFICPTIIEPRFNKESTAHTYDYMRLARKAGANTLAFQGLKDPITRWFFSNDQSGMNLARNFVEARGVDTAFVSEKEKDMLDADNVPGVDPENLFPIVQPLSLADADTGSYDPEVLKKQLKKMGNPFKKKKRHSKKRKDRILS